MEITLFVAGAGKRPSLSGQCAMHAHIVACDKAPAELKTNPTDTDDGYIQSKLYIRSKRDSTSNESESSEEVSLKGTYV
jgi:hypothetical protein